MGTQLGYQVLGQRRAVRRVRPHWPGRCGARGMSEEAIEAALLAKNESRCDPPLPEDEVCRIARSVGRYNPAENLLEQYQQREVAPEVTEPAVIAGLIRGFGARPFTG